MIAGWIWVTFKMAARRVLTPLRLACGITAVSLSLAPGTGLAHSKTDVITLANGNDITCEIKRLLQGKLSCGTDSMGTVQIEWEDVVAVISDFRYEVRLQSAVRYYGFLANASEPGLIRVLETEREHTVAVLEVVELRPIEANVADRLDIRLSAGYSYTKASSISTLSLTSEVNYQDEQGITELNGRTSQTDQDSGSTSSNRYSISRQLWTRRQELIRWFDGSYEDNDELELDYRYAVGLGLGRAFVDSNKQSFIGFLGFQGVKEKNQQGEKLNSLEGVLGITYSFWRFNTPETDLATAITAYPGITESGRWRSNIDIRLSWELIEDLFWDITSWATYDNSAQSGSDTDYGITTGIGWTY